MDNIERRKDSRSPGRRALRVAGSSLLIALLAGCAQLGSEPAQPTLVRVMPRFQLACSAQGLRPGTDAFEGCVRERVAAWRGVGGARDAPGSPRRADTKAGAAAPGAAECRLSPLGGYHCERRSKP